MKILVINSGSSSIKYKLYESTATDGDFGVLAQGGADRIGISGASVDCKRDGKEREHVYLDLPDHKKAINAIFQMLTDPEKGSLARLSDLAGVGHRVVHGGEDFSKSVLIDGDVVKAIRDNSVLAPLHNPPNLMGIQAVYELVPDMKQVAVFDTATHQTMPPKAYLYGLPKTQYTTHKIRRYGFHGTSHGYVAQKAADQLGKPIEELKLITCHLGNGGSITAFDGGKSVDTSMGMTPLAGILMGTRCGDLDPYIPLHIMQTQDMTIDEVGSLMNKQGGLLGLCGNRDMRDTMAGYHKGLEGCTQAIEKFVYEIQKYIGAYTAALNGVDAIVFTAGIGENERTIRKMVLENFCYLGLLFDEEANETHGPVITKAESKVTVLVIHTDEEKVIAADTFEILNG
ncbi:MAG: acetate kinase [Kiritimatiellales bacterium]|nr:acetate kinase [Kiritimatiellota bacterium]MBL7011585.1 acetate kinase [Kiritimatiellales bacterium]